MSAIGDDVTRDRGWSRTPERSNMLALRIICWIAIRCGRRAARWILPPICLYFLLFASAEPDPVKRDALVRAYLQQLGLSPDAPASVGFLSTGPSQLHNQMLSFTLQGMRSNVTATVSRSITSRLGENLNQGDLASNSRIEQRSYSLSASYQLSAVSGISLTASRQESQGDASSNLRTQLSSLMANWNTRLGTRLNVQLGARHSRFEGATPYSENAAYANLTQQF